MKRFTLLPAWFKLLGLAIALVTFVLPLILGAINPQPWEATAFQREVARTVILAGLLLCIISREKIEDEFISACRLRAAAISFISGIVFYIITTFLAFESGETIYTAFRVLLYQSVMYLVMFRIFIRGNWSKHDQ